MSTTSSANEDELPRLRGTPERIFVSVDESTGTSTVSFAPPDVGVPFRHDDDKTGVRAMTVAKAIVARHPGCTIVGPHFHASKAGRSKPRPRPRRQP